MFATTDVPGLGRTLVATRGLPAGTAICKSPERPLIAWSSEKGWGRSVASSVTADLAKRFEILSAMSKEVKLDPGLGNALAAYLGRVLLDSGSKEDCSTNCSEGDVGSAISGDAEAVGSAMSFRERVRDFFAPSEFACSSTSDQNDVDLRVVAFRSAAVLVLDHCRAQEKFSAALAAADSAHSLLDDLVHFCLAVQANAHEFVENGVVMAGLFEVGSKFAHSCNPCVRREWNDDDSGFTHTLICDVNEGDVLTQDYAFAGVRRWWPTFLRRHELLRTKFFVCQCARCNAPDVLRTLKCPLCSATELLLVKPAAEPVPLGTIVMAPEMAANGFAFQACAEDEWECRNGSCSFQCRGNSPELLPNFAKEKEALMLASGFELQEEISASMLCRTIPLLERSIDMASESLGRKHVSIAIMMHRLVEHYTELMHMATESATPNKSPSARIDVNLSAPQLREELLTSCRGAGFVSLEYLGKNVFPDQLETALAFLVPLHDFFRRYGCPEHADALLAKYRAYFIAASGDAALPPIIGKLKDDFGEVSDKEKVRVESIIEGAFAALHQRVQIVTREKQQAVSSRIVKATASLQPDQPQGAAGTKPADREHGRKRRGRRK